MERFEALNMAAMPVDKLLEGIMKTAQTVGMYDPVRDWMYEQIKDNLLTGFKKNNDLEVIGEENVPENSGALIAANHQSWLDAQALGSSFQGKLHFIAKSEFVDWPVLSKFIEMTESVFIRRGGDKDAISDIVKRLQEGWHICIFPEGTIPGEEEVGRDQLEAKTGLLKGRTGVVRMAIAAGVPIVPVGVSGTGLSFPPEAYPRLEMPPAQKPVPITIRYGKPIYYNDYNIDTVDHDTLRKLTDELMLEISKLVDHKRSFIPVEVPMKAHDTSGLKSYPKKGSPKAPYGALVLHGFTSHLDCVAGIEPALKELGIPYRFPILRGHGTVPQDMLGTTVDDWYEDAENALLELSEYCEKVIVCGLSMGGLMSLKLGMAHPEKISNVVLVAAALKFADPLTVMSPVLAKVFKFWDSPNAYNDARLCEERNKNYRIFSTASFQTLYDESKKVEKQLSAFDRPVLILQSKKDKVVAPKAAEAIYKKISTPSSEKKIVWFDKTGHEMMLDMESEKVIETIADYIKEEIGR